MADPYFIVDIETIPADIDEYLSLDEEKRKELLNPIDSKIIALGIRHEGENKIFYDDDEKEILSKFWIEWSRITKGSQFIPVVGFNITKFDMPFITARSFIHEVTISPFTLKQIIDLRDKINAYRYGKTRGKLKEYASLMGLKVMDVDGADVARLYKDNEHDKLKEYLANDLEITEELYKRAIKTNIIKIAKW